MTTARPSRHPLPAESDCLGHEALVHDFIRLAEENRLHHAYLFFGDEGVGKFRFASSLAHFLERRSWRVPSGAILADALFLERGAEESSLGIDAVRAIRGFLAAKPFRAPRRTVVIRDAEFLTREAESALLRIVEEPPPHALIIMVARSRETLSPPLMSRMAAVHFGRLSRAALKEILQRTYAFSAREASALAARAFGRLGYALALAKRGARPAPPQGATLAEKLESLVLSRWERGVTGEVKALSFLLDRFEIASRFNLNRGLQEKAVASRLGIPL